MTRDSISRRRENILAAAGAELARGRQRRLQRARIVAGLVALLGMALTAWVAVRSTDGPREDKGSPRLLAIDYAEVKSVAAHVDFAIIDVPSPAVVAIMPESELEQALSDAGICARVMHTESRTMLVDCTTGARATIR